MSVRFWESEHSDSGKATRGDDIVTKILAMVHATDPKRA
jgi:hypothetical protein